MPCWESKPNGRQFFLEYFIKALICMKKLCLSCCMLYLRRYQSMNYCVALIGVNFHIPVVLRVNVHFPHILLVLHPIWVEICLLSSMIYESPEKAKKYMKFSPVIGILILPRPLSCSSAFALKKNPDWQKLKCLEFLDLTCFNSSERMLWIAHLNRCGWFSNYASFSIGFWHGLAWVIAIVCQSYIT